ncbi:MAG: efflux RND transporter permease subunit [Pseudomonadota bacterium]
MTTPDSINDSGSLDKEDTNHGLIAYFARNSVAANAMMMFIIVMGLLSYFTIQRQMFPNFDLNRIMVEISYPGASPREIEESIFLKLEESIKGISEIEEVISRAFQNNGHISIKLTDNADVSEVLDLVKTRLDGVSALPADMEPLQVRSIEPEQDVIELTLSGDYSLEELKGQAKTIENELLQLPNLSIVNVMAPSTEIAIEVQPERLREYNISVLDVVNAIQQYSGNFSAGNIQTDAGSVSVRVQTQRYSGEAFGNIPIITGNNNGQILLKEIADLKDGSTEGLRYFKYSGTDSVYISIKANSDQDIVPIAETVKLYVEQKNSRLPEGMNLATFIDLTYYLDARLNMMLSNLLQGAVLVALMLTIFLRFKIAFWVMVGLPVCFLGAIMMMPIVGVTINIMSLFAFIMVLGIVVDDAIVTGEAAFANIEKNGVSEENVITGVRKVAMPATFGVLTTIAVFAPFVFTTGPDSAFFFNIAAVVILCLVFSLIESKLILPAHLATMREKPVKSGSLRDRFNCAFFAFVNGRYKRFIQRCAEWRWAVLAFFIAVFAISVALIHANFVRVLPNPKVPHDFPSIKIEMSKSSSDEATVEAIQQIEQMMLQVDKQTEQEFGQKMIKERLVFNDDNTEGEILAVLVNEELRPYNTFDLTRRWRENMPDIPGMRSIKIIDDVGSMDDMDDGDFGYTLYGADITTLNAAGRYFAQLLEQQPGIYDVSSTIDPATKEIQLQILPEAERLGLTLSDISQQVGLNFYGGEAQRIVRGGEEIRVMVRYPRATREKLSELKYTLIYTPSGHQVKLGDVVTLYETEGVNYIRRKSGYRTVYLWGAIDASQVEPNQVVKDISSSIIPAVVERFPTVKTELGGDISDQIKQQNQQIMFFVAGMLMVYILLAVPLRSYSQPLIIMSVIPFSAVGAIWGHFLMGLDLSMMSSFGLIAAAGVVINDSLVMTDYINKHRNSGMHIKEAIINAGCARFRAITLTSITTFCGVLPIMFETSLQAAFVVPMAVALGFSVLFATTVTLILVPCFYLILEDIKGLSGLIIKKKSIAIEQ